MNGRVFLDEQQTLQNNTPVRSTTIGQSRFMDLQKIDEIVKSEFTKLDVSKRGTIQTKNIEKILGMCGLTLTKRQLSDFIYQFDADQSGTVTLDALLYYIHVLKNNSISRQDLISRLPKTIKSDDLTLVLKKIAPTLTQEEMDEIILDLDVRDEGIIKPIDLINKILIE